MSDSSTTSLPFWQRSLPYVLYGMLALLYLVIIPTGESPDEPGHLRCIEQVSVQERLPFVDPPSRGEVWWHPEAILSGYICYHMPLYYIVAGGSQRAITAVTNESPAYHFPPHNYDFGPQINLFVHSERKATAWQIIDPWHILGLRLLSIILSGVVVWSAIQITHFLVPGQANTAVLAGLLVAGWPQFVYFSRSINNDILATALAVLILVGLLNIGKPRRYPLLALLSALALLTKLTTSFTIVAICMVWAVEAWQQRAKIRPYLYSLAISIAIWSTTTLLILLQPTLNQNLNYGLNYISWFPDRIKTAAYWLDVAEITLSSGWVRFAWMNLAAPMSHAYWAWSIVSVLVSSGIIYSLRKLRQAPTNHLYLQTFILITWLAGGLASYIRINMTHFQPQFRFIFVLLPIIVAIAAIGLKQLTRRLPQRPASHTIFLLISLIWLGYNTWVLVDLVVPTYY
jgi:4-amino-4-deoxy-L-arabinose transferase-like glycosyltransferase